MLHPVFYRSRQAKTGRSDPVFSAWGNQAGRFLAAILCFLPALFLLLAPPVARAQSMPLPTFADGFFVNGSASAVAVDANGRFYIGGSFSHVNGVPRNNLARFNADGTLDIDWNPNASGGVSDGRVNALVIVGNTVYVGGRFTNIGGQARNRIAALDAATGNATAWNPNSDGGSNGEVLTLAISGNTVYAGGYFTTIGGQSRNRIAALDATTGNATAWNPNADSIVKVLAISGSTVYAGGVFNNIGGQLRTGIAALDAATGNATAWNPNPSGSFLGITVQDFRQKFQAVDYFGIILT